VIRAGKIGQILLDCLSVAGVYIDHLVISDSNPARAGSVAKERGLRTISLNDEAACKGECS
jgi:pyrroline-5-carboxylate reductase